MSDNTYPYNHVGDNEILHIAYLIDQAREIGLDYEVIQEIVNISRSEPTWSYRKIADTARKEWDI